MKEEFGSLRRGCSRRQFLAASLVLAGSVALNTSAGCSPKTPESGEAPTISFDPGTYQGSGNGQHGIIEVQATFGEHSIESIEVTDNTDTEFISRYAVELLPEDIIKYQSTDIDTISGATLSSMALLNAVQDCFDQANARIENPTKKPEAQQIEKEAESCDVLVIGAGTSGILAALGAAGTEKAGESSGLQVKLIEQLSYPGGSFIVSGCIFGAPYGSALHKSGSISTITEDQYISYLREWSEDDPLNCLNENLQREQFRAIWPAIERVLALGGPWSEEYSTPWPMPSDRNEYPQDGWVTLDMVDESGNQFPVYEKPVADTLGDRFVGVLNSYSNIDLKCLTKAVGLLVENGEVVGATVSETNPEANEEYVYEIRAKKVILATGAPTRNSELLREAGFEYLDAVVHCGAGATGAGITMLQDAGFQPQIIGKGGMLYNAVKSPYAQQDGISLGLLGYPIVNKSGERYYDETLPDVFSGIFTVAQQDNTGYLIADSGDNILMTTEPWYYNGNHGQLVGEYAVEKGWILKVETLEEIPDAIGVPKDTFLKTMKEFEQAASGEIKDKYARNAQDMIVPRQPPFYVEPIFAVMNEAYVGVKTLDGSLAILDGQGAPIPNLQGSGTLISQNIFYVNYPIAGAGLTTAMSTGYLAGQTARNEILS